MKIEQEFTLERPRDEVWAFFKDVPAVADCMPGAEYLSEKAPGTHAGRMSVKVGPFQASFEGTADVTYIDESHSVTMMGKGVDKRGASRGKMTLDCALHDKGERTRVTIDADVQLSGSIAQFGRTGIVHEVATTLISDFVSNVEETLGPPEAGAGRADDAEAGHVDRDYADGGQAHEGGARRPAVAGRRGGGSRELSATRLIWVSFVNWLRRLGGRRK